MIAVIEMPMRARILIGIAGPRKGGNIINKGLTRANTVTNTQIELYRNGSNKLIEQLDEVTLPMN
jgi:hypothetical protein